MTGQAFLAQLITQYAALHKKTAGPHAEAYIKQIGIRTGEWLERFFNEDSGASWTVEKYAQVIVDIKNAIGGHFRIVDVHSDHVVVRATECPFGSAVKHAPHLCNMTSSVFGGIASRQFGYGEVSLRKRIAAGDSVCEVAVYFTPANSENGDIYENIPVTPENGSPFLWEEETIRLLNEEMRRNDEYILELLDELETLRNKVKESSGTD
ncbi:methanogen output domain 1-containing protein [Alteribacter natronophilus]|uniref:methanogen output domain 1-containing protein n=1 Tax=Alteribacter natronophilus TaxID=2583810 RepID=UPI001FE804DA|nr:methanogen output domain 1-containing protein [Alteribacter natronophilus]